MCQAISIGIFLFILNRKKGNSLFILGIFLTVSGLSSLSDIFEVFSLYVNNKYLKVLSFNFLWLMPTLLYLYVERVSIEKIKKCTYLLLIPGIFDFILNIGLIFFPINIYQAVHNSLIYGLFELLGLIYLCVLIVVIYKKIIKHSRIVRNQYSSVENRELKWLYVVINLLVVLFIFGLLSSIFFPRFISELILSLFGLFITFWIAYNGLLQQTSINLSTVVSKGKETNKLIKDIEIQTKLETSLNDGNSSNIDNESSEIKTERHKEIFTKVKELLKEERLFLNPDLTIAIIAEKIGEHPRTVSRSINIISNENFNRFINKYRVKEAKEVLRTKEKQHLNIEGIGIEAGFNSNSAFYTAFKKELNVTPLQFLKNTESGK